MILKAFSAKREHREAIRYFDRIYREESQLKDLPAEERYKERLVKIKPLLDELFARLETV